MTEPDRTFSHPKKAEFIDAYIELGTITHAARKAGISRRTVYDWRQADEEFALALHDCREQVTDDLEREAITRAKDGSDTLLIFMLKANRPEKYRENVKIEHAGTIKQDLSSVDSEQLRERARALIDGD